MDKKKAPRKNAIRWLHGNGEDTGLPSRSFDLLSIAYVVRILLWSNNVLRNSTAKF